MLRVDAQRFAGRIHVESAQAFERFLLAPPTQAVIADYGSSVFGRPLFVPLRAAE